MRSLRVAFLLSVSAFAFVAAPAAGQKLQIKFAAAIAYQSGGPDAGAVAIADLNGDGIPDLVVANYCQTPGQNSCPGYGQAAVLLGNGQGTFQPAVRYSTGANGAVSVAVGDVNSDGIPDLVVVSRCDALRNSIVTVAAIGDRLSGNLKREAGSCLAVTEREVFSQRARSIVARILRVNSDIGRIQIFIAVVTRRGC